MFKICHHYESLQYHLNVIKPTDKPVESITKHRFNRGGSNHQLRRLVHLEVNPVLDQQILLITQSNVVIVVQLIPKIDARLIDQPASNVTELIIIHLNAGPPIAVPILPKNTRQLNRFHGRGRTPHG